MSDANVAQAGDELASVLGQSAIQSREQYGARVAGERIIYRASGGRRVAFSFIF